MKRLINKSAVIGIALMLLMMPQSNAQEVMAALQKVQDTYSQLTDMKAEMSIAAYVNEEEETPYYTQNAKIDKKGDLFYYQMGDIEGLVNKEYNFWVDHQSKQINGGLRTQDDQKKVNEAVMFDVEKTLAKYDKVVLVDTEGALSHYRIFSADQMIKQTDLWIDADHLVRKLVYHYNEAMVGSNSRVEIKFLIFDKHPRMSASAFSESRFVKKVNGEWRAGKAYPNYKVLFNPQ